MTDKTRARKGGEYGVNGEFYFGGEFLPSSPNTTKGEMSVETRKAAKKASSEERQKLQSRIDEVLSDWYPNNNSTQARELFTRYLKDNGVNTWSINPYGVDLAKWVL